MARHGPKNDDERQKLSKVPNLRSQTTDTPVGAHPLYGAFGSGTHRLPVYGSYLGCERKACHKNVLVMEDHFTRYTQAYITNNHTVCTTARVLYNEFFSVFGFPGKLMSDQAAEIMGQVISELCDLLGVTKIRTSPYHPQTNGTVERVHQTLRRMIAKMDPDKRAKWPSHLGPILIVYNATRSLITGYSPYFLMFGRRPRLPVNLLFLTVRPNENSRTTDEYLSSLYDKLKSALASARDAAILEAQRQSGFMTARPGW